MNYEEVIMGEIIVSVVIGGCLAVSGIVMNIILHKEEKIVEENKK